MLLWNMYIMRQNVIAESHLPAALEGFVANHGAQLIAQGLRGNLVLHLVNLSDYGLIRPAIVLRCLNQLDAIAASGAT